MVSELEVLLTMHCFQKLTKFLLPKRKLSKFRRLLLHFPRNPTLIGYVFTVRLMTPIGVNLELELRTHMTRMLFLSPHRTLLTAAHTGVVCAADHFHLNRLRLV